LREAAAEVVGMVAGATGVAAEATVEAGFMPHSAGATGVVAEATVVVVFTALSEDFVDQATASGVAALMALLRIMAARYI
jgi:hypothetical protein